MGFSEMRMVSGLAVTQLAQVQAQHYASIAPLSTANGG